MSIKFALIKVLYSILELLPEKISNKIKMIGNIIVHDWQMESFCMFDIRKAMDEEEAKALFYQDDQMTMRILHHQYVLGALYVPPEIKNSFFYYHRKEFYFPFEADIKEIRRTGRLFKGKYGIYDVGPEVYYFNHGLYYLDEHYRNMIEGKCIIDAGAYKGESLIALLKYKPSRIISFELSPKNYEKIVANLERNNIPSKCYALVQNGLGDVEEDIFIDDLGDEIANKNSTAMCHITTIDNYLKNNPIKVGMIKADIEGAGLALVKGGMETIKKDRPLISIAVYHSADEFLGIPKLFKEMNLKYKFILRCQTHSNILGEIVLLGLPD